jgi:hypothetical protein
MHQMCACARHGVSWGVDARRTSPSMARLHSAVSRQVCEAEACAGWDGLAAAVLQPAVEARARHTMLLEFSEPPSLKILEPSSLSPEARCAYLQTDRTIISAKPVWSI